MSHFVMEDPVYLIRVKFTGNLCKLFFFLNFFQVQLVRLMWMSAVRIHAKTTQLASMMSTDTFVNVTRDSEVRKFVLWAWQPC